MRCSINSPSFRRANNTALYDACYLGVEKVQRGAHPKRALLLISDGQTTIRDTLQQVRRLLKESDVVFTPSASSAAPMPAALWVWMARHS